MGLLVPLALGVLRQSLARRQFEWLRSIPGTPQDANGPTKAYFTGLGEMYVVTHNGVVRRIVEIDVG